MSTGDFFNPPNLDALYTILEATRRQARKDPVHRGLGGRKRWAKGPRARSAQKIRNPLYSRALDASGVNDGNQGKTLNGVGIPQTGNTFSGAYTYPGMGTGQP
jgi:hypothetical protein